MTRHIGIVGCSAEGAALCYRTICLEAEPLMGKHAHPEVTMHTIALAEYMKLIEPVADWEAVGDLMLRSAHALKRAGADFLDLSGQYDPSGTALRGTAVAAAVAAYCRRSRQGGQASRLQKTWAHGHKVSGERAGVSGEAGATGP